MDLIVERNCPSCGAPIEMGEQDRLVICRYCDVGNYLVSSGVSRFILPDKAGGDVAREELLFAPYLRFKGNIFSCRGKRVDHKVIDTTHIGAQIQALPISLGLRPQAMKLLPAADGGAGRFVVQTEKTIDVFTKACNTASIFNDRADEPVYHQVLIGETVSCIYLPLYCQDEAIYDAVLKRPLEQKGSMAAVFEKATGYNPAWNPHFLLCICPHCGGAMIGEHDALVLACPNCESLWGENNGQFRRVKWRMVHAKATSENPVYLPFWKICPAAEGAPLTNFADFIRLTNQPMVVRKEHEGREFSFWIPGFKIRPKFFLLMAKSITMAQAHFDGGDCDMEKSMFPVTLPAHEAVQSLKTLLADMAMDKRHFLPRLPSVAIHARQVELVFLPFLYSGHDLVQEQSGVAVASTVIDFGRSL